MNILQLLFAALGTLGFLVIAQAPRRSWFIASLIGGLGYLVYDVLVHLNVNAPLAVFLGCLTACLLGQAAARRTRMIASVYLTAAVIPEVPGLGLYRCMSLLGERDTAAGLAAGAEAMSEILMIALAVAISGYAARLVVHRLQQRQKRLSNS